MHFVYNKIYYNFSSNIMNSLQLNCEDLRFKEEKGKNDSSDWIKKNMEKNVVDKNGKYHAW